MNNEFLYGWFQDAIEEWYDPKTLAKRLLWPIAAVYNEWGETSIKLTTQTFVEFVDTVTKNNINDNVAKQIMEEALQTGNAIAQITKQYTNSSMSEDEIIWLAQEIVQNNPKAHEDYKWGKLTTIAFFVWQLMKATKWSLNADTAKTILEKILNS